jgi:hypothetical protein
MCAAPLAGRADRTTCSPRCKKATQRKRKAAPTAPPTRNDRRDRPPGWTGACAARSSHADADTVCAFCDTDPLPPTYYAWRIGARPHELERGGTRAGEAVIAGRDDAGRRRLELVTTTSRT